MSEEETQEYMNSESGSGSDNSYVQVTSEEAAVSGPLIEFEEPGESGSVPPEIPPADDDEEDLYGSGGEGGEEETAQEEAQSQEAPTPPPPKEFSQSVDDSQWMESPEPDEEKEEPPPLTPTPEPSPEPEPEPMPASEPFLSRGVEDVPSSEPYPPTPTETEAARPITPETVKATGYLSFLNFLHPILLFIIYWRDVKLTAVILGVCLVVLLTLTLNTLIHTVVLVLLSFMVVSLTYIVTKISIDSFYNKEIRNPFHDYLSREITLPEDKIVEWTRYVVKKLDDDFNSLVRLLLFDNIKASLKFSVILWVMSFFTNCFSVLSSLFFCSPIPFGIGSQESLGMKLPAVVALLFSVPVLYDRYQSSIDCHVEKMATRAEEIINKVKGYIPAIGKSKAE